MVSALQLESSVMILAHWRLALRALCGVATLGRAGCWIASLASPYLLPVALLHVTTTRSVPSPHWGVTHEEMGRRPGLSKPRALAQGQLGAIL